MRFSEQVAEWLAVACVFIGIAAFAVGPFIVLSFLGPWMSLVGTALFSIAWCVALYGNSRGYPFIRFPLFVGVLGCHVAAFEVAITQIISQHG